MAFKEVSRVELTEVIRRWQTSLSLPALARASSLSRSTGSTFKQPFASPWRETVHHPPITRYVSSPRSHPAPILEFTYPHADAVRQIRSSGAIKWHQHSVS